MGLSAFNAMRARMKAEAKALGKTSVDVEVKEIKPAETSVEPAKEKVEDSIKESETSVEPAKEKVEDSIKESETKKTDAEKLKKKKV